MDNSAEMLNALESHYKAQLDRISLDINNSLRSGSGSGTLDYLVDNISEYSNTLSQFNFVQKLKENILKEGRQDEG
jgi:hypothetical protein